MFLHATVSGKRICVFRKLCGNVSRSKLCSLSAFNVVIDERRSLFPALGWRLLTQLIEKDLEAVGVVSLLVDCSSHNSIRRGSGCWVKSHSVVILCSSGTHRSSTSRVTVLCRFTSLHRLCGFKQGQMSIGPTCVLHMRLVGRVADRTQNTDDSYHDQKLDKRESRLTLIGSTEAEVLHHIFRSNCLSCTDTKLS